MTLNMQAQEGMEKLRIGIMIKKGSLSDDSSALQESKFLLSTYFTKCETHWQQAQFECFVWGISSKIRKMV